MSKYMSEQNFNDLVEVLKTKYLHTELLERYLLNYAYPIGTVYESINNVSPETFLGGKWETFGAGKVLIGAGTGTDANGVSQTFSVSENDKNKGEYSHQLTKDEMPSHSHEVAQQISGTAGIPWKEIQLSDQSSDTSIEYEDVQMKETGNDKKHNNIQPYVTVYRWVRTA